MSTVPGDGNFGRELTADDHTPWEKKAEMEIGRQICSVRVPLLRISEEKYYK